MRHIVSILLENEAGALSRVAGLFSARGYNLESLTVAPAEDPSLSRMTLVTSGSDQMIEQIIKQLNKLVDVVKLIDLAEGPHIGREMMLIKVRAEGNDVREEVKRLIDIVRGHISDVTDSSYTLELTGPGEKLDALIQELARRYKDNTLATKPDFDSWTSSNQLSIAFLDISGSGVNDAERDFILNKTSEDLRMTKRFSIVEREIIDKLLEELNLSTSSLTDPTTALKLGRILSANLIVTGSLSHQGEQWLANMRFIETETTAIKCSVSTLIKKGDAGEVATELSKAINSKLRTEYPLQAKVTSVSDNTVEINIGQLSGVSTGMEFAFLQENNMPVDVATVTTVEQLQSYITITNNSLTVEEGMRLREKIQE